MTTTKKKTKSATAGKDATKSTAGKALAESAAAETTGTAAPAVSAGDWVHYHPEHQTNATAQSAHAALVLHVADAKSGRVDLLVYDKSGEPKTERDVYFTAERAQSTWTTRDAA